MKKMRKKRFLSGPNDDQIWSTFVNFFNFQKFPKGEKFKKKMLLLGPLYLLWNKKIKLITIFLVGRKTCRNFVLKLSYNANDALAAQCKRRSGVQCVWIILQTSRGTLLNIYAWINVIFSRFTIIVAIFV